MENRLDATSLLLTRQSCPNLEEPAPNSEQLDFMFKAACQAPDHASLTPWRFILIRGDTRKTLGSIFVQSILSRQKDISQETKEKYQNLPLKAPLLMAVVCCEKEHPRVPKVEQYLSLGAAVGNILLAAYAQNIGAMWRTGDVSYCPLVSNALGLVASESLCGFVYLGTAKNKKKEARRDLTQEIISTWYGE